MRYSKFMTALSLTVLLAACASNGATPDTASHATKSLSDAVNNYQFSASELEKIDAARQQATIDAARLKDLAYWIGLFEAYKEKKGIYPLQDKIQDKRILVKILTPEQRVALNLDELEKEDTSGPFENMKADVLIAELEAGLGTSIEKRYDPTLNPNGRTIGYFYFATPDGYLLWTPCGMCEISPISTYLMDGKTVTLNIASEGMVDQVTKAHTRDEMLNHPKYKAWLEIFEVMGYKD